MARSKPFFVVIALALGLLQVWDARAFQAGGGIAALAIAGVLAAVLTLWLFQRPAVWLGGVLTALALMTAARMLSPINLNGLHLAVFFAVLPWFLFTRLLARQPGTR